MLSVKAIVCAIFEPGIDTLSDVWMVSAIFKMVAGVSDCASVTWIASVIASTVGATPIPVPVRVDRCGVLGALSATETYAEKGVVTELTTGLSEVGVKVTGMVQCASGASVVPQVVAPMANWPVSVPVRVMEEIVSGTTPVLVRVRFLTALVIPTFCEPKFS